MLNGTVIIANDLLGVVVGSSDEHYSIRDKEGNVRKIDKLVCKEVSSPHALAYMLYNKVYKNLCGSNLVDHT